MYARYIPPPKPAQGSKVEASHAPPASSSRPAAPAAAAAAPAPADGFSYARYVPGVKAATKAEPVPKVHYFDDEPSLPQAKRKRETAPEASDHGRHGSKMAKLGVTQEALEDAGPKKKKNRRKRKQRTRADESDSTESDEEPSVPEPAPVRSLQSKPAEFPEPSETRGEETMREKERPKEKSKRKQSPSEEPHDNDVSMADAKPTVDETVLSPQPETVPVKDKKRIKEKKKARKVGDIPEGEQEEDLRHKSVLERKTKSLKIATAITSEGTGDEVEEEAELHGLEPLPQPEVVVDEEGPKPTYDTLPSWLANPIRVSQDSRAPFTDIGIPPKTSRVLEQKGFPEAFVVQTAVIPLLLPTSKRRPGDVLVSAATGSGKTLSYALPIVRDISQGVVTRLRALVVLPTRELVRQAQEVFEMCSKAYEGDGRKKVRVGVAIGSQMIKMEQETLLQSESRYDPVAYKEIQEDGRRQQVRNAASADVDDMGTDSINGQLGPWEGQVLEYCSTVDVLICTPGRLVEHIEQTTGFSLDYVRWLVVDEADKLLAQSFQGWLPVVLDKFQLNRFSARDFPDMAYSGVRKVILSATLTRDLSLLSQLALRRPQLIVLENEGAAQVAEHTLPTSLREFAVRVHETNLKPLYLLELLRGGHMTVADPASAGRVVSLLTKEAAPALVPDANSSSDDSSDTSSDSASDGGSDPSSDSTSDTSSDEDDSSDADSAPAPQAEEAAATPASAAPPPPHSLIFTNSNESALRLSRLLTLLDGSLATHISTITSTTATHLRRKTLRAFTSPSSPVRLIIASDLVARGIDIPKLGHVINYDLPPSVAGYVHRVGRTARAGRSGCAWTLVGDQESGWFWGKIAKGQGMRRMQKVERTRIEEMGEEQVKEYEDALTRLGKEALELRRR
ncbi:DEAD box ATP-dependent RNA helicase [Drechmeria coniospora]|uniref:ATP-dependent RNA helicase n=1 Tax=Drechmeria coniospora TaxID=98403 RepID=A0A151GVU2_DRECN|nr:DEAD box ATP-dependent RNA helicase [Drechmeria coniospora]KYK61191.1 DEAD box ATP-dependent RNA helicase [Drechmeria coniospora]